jgi:hypothetical protein
VHFLFPNKARPLALSVYTIPQKRDKCSQFYEVIILLTTQIPLNRSCVAVGANASNTCPHGSPEFVARYQNNSQMCLKMPHCSTMTASKSFSNRFLPPTLLLTPSFGPC